MPVQPFFFYSLNLEAHACHHILAASLFMVVIRFCSFALVNCGGRLICHVVRLLVNSSPRHSAILIFYVIHLKIFLIYAIIYK